MCCSLAYLPSKALFCSQSMACLPTRSFWGSKGPQETEDRHRPDKSERKDKQTNRQTNKDTSTGPQQEEHEQLLPQNMQNWEQEDTEEENKRKIKKKGVQGQSTGYFRKTNQKRLWEDTWMGFPNTCPSQPLSSYHCRQDTHAHTS